MTKHDKTDSEVSRSGSALAGSRKSQADHLAWMERTARRMARRVCGTRFRGHLEDATQEALVAAWGASRQGKGRGIQAVAARRGATGYLRKMCGDRWQRTALVETMGLDDAEFYREMSAMEGGYEAVDDDDAFDGMLALLPAGADGNRYRRILRAVLRDRVTQDEAAEAEGISQGWLSRLLAEGLEYLRLRAEAAPEPSGFDLA